MKKLYITAAAFGLAAVMGVSQVMAAATSAYIQVETDKVSNTADYVTSSGETKKLYFGDNTDIEYTASIDDLLTNLDKATTKKPFRTTMTVDSYNKGLDEPIAVKLRMSIASPQPTQSASTTPSTTPTPQPTHSPNDNPLDYYDWVITIATKGAKNGDVVYNSAEVSEDSTALTRDITLCTLNEGLVKDTEKFDIVVKPNEEMAAKMTSSADKKAVENISYSIVYEAAPTPSATPTPTTTARKTSSNTDDAVTTSAPVATRSTSTRTPEPQGQEVNTSGSDNEDEHTEEPAEAEATPTPASKTSGSGSTSGSTTKATASPAPTATPKAEVKVCGKDIAAGRYVVSGNGKVNIKTKAGVVKSDTTVRDSSKKNIEGVEQFVVNLEEGDVVTVTPLAGQTKSSVKFEKSNTTTTAKAAKATASPSATTKPKTTTSPSKTNPKTGDTGLAIGLVIGIMAVAGVSVGGLEAMKRKKEE